MNLNVILLPAAGVLIVMGILWFIRARYFADGSVRLANLYVPFLLAGSGALLALFILLPAVQRQVFARGGGGAELEPTSDPFVIPKPAGLPAMCAVPKPTKPPKDMQVAQNCFVTFPQTLQVNSYCLNPATKLGGATVILPPGTSAFVNLPSNCSVIVEEDKLYAKKVACYGASGSKVTITVQDSCIPPAANLPVHVQPSCPPDFKLNANGACEYVLPPNAPVCPKDALFLGSQNCCMDSKVFANLSPCPKEYDLMPTRDDTTKFVCQLKLSLLDTTATKSYSITLGTCNSPKNDAPSTGDDGGTVPGCVIDPATGACP